jgi:hypothetical protein
LAVTASHEILPLFDLIHDRAADHSHGSDLFRTWGKPTLDHFGGEDVRLRRRFVRSTIAGVDPLQECLAVMKIEQAKTTWTQTWWSHQPPASFSPPRDGRFGCPSGSCSRRARLSSYVRTSKFT